MSKIISLRTPVTIETPGRASSRPGLPVRPAMQEFLTDCRRRLERGTCADYQLKMHVFCAWAEEHKPPIGLEYIGRKVMADFVDHLAATHPGRKHSPLSDNTKANYVRVVRCFLHWCRRDETYGEYMSRDTIDAINLPKTALVIHTTFTDEQVKQLYKVAGQNRDNHQKLRDVALLHVLANTGIRASELCTLELGKVNLDPEDASITVMGKGRKMRRIVLGELTRRKLESYILAFRQEAAAGDRVFLSLSRRDYLGNLNIGGLEQIVRALVKKAGITNFRATPHDFRHYFACASVKRGIEIYQLSRLLGHADIETTQRYLESLGSSWDMRPLVASIMR